MLFSPKVVNSRLVRLYVVPNQRTPEGIPESTTFEPRTEYEIGDIKWFALSEFNHKSCNSVWPFLPLIKAFVYEHGGSKQEATLMRKKSSKEWLDENMFKNETEVEGPRHLLQLHYASKLLVKS